MTISRRRNINQFVQQGVPASIRFSQGSCVEAHAGQGASVPAYNHTTNSNIPPTSIIKQTVRSTHSQGSCVEAHVGQGAAVPYRRWQERLRGGGKGKHEPRVAAGFRWPTAAGKLTW
jgi:hypothetical protein